MHVLSLFLEAALDLVKRYGWRLLPVAHGQKIPLIKNWSELATDDPVQLKKWWDEWPSAGIGALLGQASGLIVVDVDGPEGAAFIERMRLPETLTAITTKGKHYFFRCPDHPMKKKIRVFPEVDLLADGCFVIVAPSIHPSGEPYRFEHYGHAIAKIPEEMLERFGSPEIQSLVIKPPRPASAAPILEGKRNTILASEAGKLRRFGKDYLEINSALTEINFARCVPPLSGSEVTAIASSISQYEPAIDLDESHLTDLGLCRRFVNEHGDKLRFCPNLGSWLIWDGHKWDEDDRDHVFQLAKKTVRNLYVEASKCSNQRQREVIGRFASSSESAIKISAFLTLARRELTIPISDLDAEPWLLNCRTGVVNFKTGRVPSPTPKMMLSMATAAEYRPDAKAPLWEKTLIEIFQGDKDLIRYFQKATGYALFGENKERVFLACYGIGANGKSVLLNTICKLLGDYGCFTPAQTLMVKQPGSIPNDIARLKGKRFVVASESDKNARISEETLKLLAGGSDNISARFLHHEWFSFHPSFLVFLMTNYRPRVAGDDEAIWDRIRLIPFERRFEPHERNLNLEAELVHEWPGILNWLIEGAKLAAAEGLGKNEKVASATASYRQAQNPVARFVAAMYEEGPGHSCQGGRLYYDYKTWAIKTGEQIIYSQRQFSETLERLGYKKERRGGHVIYFGLSPVFDKGLEPELPSKDKDGE